MDQASSTHLQEPKEISNPYLALQPTHVLMTVANFISAPAEDVVTATLRVWFPPIDEVEKKHRLVI